MVRMDAEQTKFFADFYSGAGGEVDECSIMLRFFGDTLEPESISALLGIQPTEWCRKDKLRSSGQPGAWQTGYWLLDCERTTDTADNQIKLLLEKDLPNDLAIWQSLSVNFSAEIKVHLSLARWARGTILSAATLQLLSDRGLRLQLDIYAKLPPSVEFPMPPESPQK
jgi:hypothetical protein